ncbi:hypothetical protein [Tichowtungia aerotolerans]|uniref:Uncharacterized protein n=1 Tax=Tichowtungia aerotolerans TaxID=2697043 RepID=A0A6P1M4Q4_9BACT|nr:hypothetical protein [Tichowtungia aerotolerans]QHI68817.1 hypothetical protein GT409_04920 [Tichowtungia aerotolerans]
MKLIRTAGWISYFSAILFISILVLGSFFRVGMTGNPPTMFRDMVDGTASRPFVYRVLAPTVIRSLENALPDVLNEKICTAVAARPVSELFERYEWELEYASAYLIAVAVLFVSLLLFVHAFGVLARSQYEMNPVFLRVLSLVALAGLPCFFRYYSYLYDFPHLVLFCYALAMMSLRRWKVYILLFVLACLSKETTVLLIAVFIIHFWKKRQTLPFFALAVVQVVIFVTIKCGLNILFQKNPGASVEFHLGHNLMLIPYNFAQAGMFAAIAVLCARDWAHKPSFLKSAVWMLPPLVGLTFLFGLLDEYRDYYEIYPVILLLAAPAVAEYLRITPCKLSNVEYNPAFAK